MTSLSLAVVFWLGGIQVYQGKITTGDFVAFISYLGLLSWPVMALGWVINLLKRGGVSLERIETHPGRRTGDRRSSRGNVADFSHPEDSFNSECLPLPIREPGCRY